MRSLHVQEKDVRVALLQRQAEGLLTFASPTTDHNYKQVFLCTSPEVSRDFCNAILKITMPRISLNVRGVKVESEFVDGDAVNRQLASGGPKPQNLKVDALFCVDIEDSRRSRLLQTRSGVLMSQPARILAEMQVEQQQFGARLMSYASKVLAELPIDVKNDVIPPPVYAIAFCMWGCAELVKGADSIRSDKLDVEETGRFIETGYASVFLGKLIEIKNKDRGTLNEELAAGQIALKGKVAVFFSKDTWDDLNFEEKKVYLWLEFLSFAHIMTEAQKDKSLTCLINGDPKAVEIFNKAYEAVKLDFGGTMERIKENYPDIYGYEEERLEKERVQIDRDQAQAQVKESVVAQADIIAMAVQYLPDSDTLDKLISKIASSLQMPVYEELVHRKVITGDRLEQFRQQIEKQERTEVEARVAQAGKTLNSLVERADQLKNDLADLEERVGTGDRKDVLPVELRNMLQRLESLETVEQNLNSDIKGVLNSLEQGPWAFHIQALEIFSIEELVEARRLDVSQDPGFNDKKQSWKDNPQEGERVITTARENTKEKDGWLFLVRAAQESLCEIPHGEEVYGILIRVLALRKKFFEDVKAKIRTLEEVLEKTRKSLEKQVKQLALMSPMSPKRTKREVPTVDTTPIPFKVTSSSSSEGGYKYDKGLK